MNWMMVLYIWLAGVPLFMVLIWVMDQAYMAKKSWGVRSRAADGAIGSVAWPIVLVLAAGSAIGTVWTSLWEKQYLFKKKPVKIKKCNRGLRSDEV